MPGAQAKNPIPIPIGSIAPHDAKKVTGFHSILICWGAEACIIHGIVFLPFVMETLSLLHSGEAVHVKQLWQGIRGWKRVG